MLDDAGLEEISRKVIPVTSLINQYQDRLQLRPLAIKAAYHRPCHLNLLSDPDASVTLLKQVPELEIKALKSHCCGMAGSWGMASRHYELSRTIAGHLVAALESSGAATAITDCPTCRMQMEQFCSMPILHPLEIVARSMA